MPDRRRRRRAQVEPDDDGFIESLAQGDVSADASIPPSALGGERPPAGAGAPLEELGQQRRRRRRESTRSMQRRLVVPVHLQYMFTQKRANELRAIFDYFDKDGSGAIDRDEVAAVLRGLGQDDSADQIKAIFKEVGASDPLRLWLRRMPTE